MRVRIEFDGSIALGQHGEFRKALIGIPDNVNKVCDLIHHLHTRFELPQIPVVLAVDGFSLLPAFCVQEVVRDGDLVEIRRAYCASRSGKGKHELKDQISNSPVKVTSVRQLSSPAPTRQLSSPAPTALPALKDISPAPSLQETPEPPQPVVKRPRVEKNSQLERQPALPRKKEQEQEQATQPVEAEPGEAPKGIRHTATAEKVQAMPGLGGISALPRPDNSDDMIWTPVDREPRAGEWIRFRMSFGLSGLSGFLTFQCVGVEDSETGLERIAVLRSPVGVDQQQPLHKLLQLCVGELPEAASIASSPKKPPEHKNQKRNLQQNLQVQEQQQQQQPIIQKQGNEIPASPVRSALKRTSISSAPTVTHPILGEVRVPADADPGEFVQQKMEKLQIAIKRQVEYYFGDANWEKDNFLRAQCDEEGWVSLKFVSSFNRMKPLSQNLAFIIECIMDSQVVVISECKEWIRKR